PAILSCHAVSGEVDYRLHVVARDLGALDTLLTRIIAALPGVGAVDSVILMRPIVAARGVPLGG
ncbi:MAG: Lrp/AsnC ligand binding domain-containing protein, partial [Rubricella sp.]